MTSDKKFRPSDGDDAEAQEEERHDNFVSEDEIFEEFVSQSEKEYEERRSRETKMLERLKKERGFGAEDDRQQQNDGKPGASPGKIYGDEIEPQKVFSLDGEGIFNRKGAFNNFGQSGSTTKIKRVLKDANLRGVAVKKQREFMQLLGKYHGLKGKNLGTLGKEEVAKFEAGLRRGSSDARFDQFKEELKKEGIIRNSEDVKKLFSKQEARKISNALTGKEDEFNRFDRANKSDLVRRRTEEGGPQRPGRMF